MFRMFSKQPEPSPPIPEIFRNLLRAGSWIHPGDDVIYTAIPFFTDPVDFLVTEDMVRFESRALEPDENYSFNWIANANTLENKRPIDPAKMLSVAVCRHPGADILICLDLFMNAEDPPVAANDWSSGFPSVWREVSPYFTTFCKSIGIQTPTAPVKGNAVVAPRTRRDLRNKREHFPVPLLLEQLIARQRWHHPGHEVIAKAIPFLSTTVNFIDSIDEMRLATSYYEFIECADGGRSFDSRMVRLNADLPWLDTSKILVLAESHSSEPHAVIALDFRSDVKNPRVVASEQSYEKQASWQEIAPTFEAFVRKVGIDVRT